MSSICICLRICLCVQNMAFQADQKIKGEIVRCLGTDHLFCLLSDSDNNVLMKTLGLLRNLLSTRTVRKISNALTSSNCT